MKCACLLFVYEFVEKKKRVSVCMCSYSFYINMLQICSYNVLLINISHIDKPLECLYEDLSLSCIGFQSVPHVVFSYFHIFFIVFSSL